MSQFLQYPPTYQNGPGYTYQAANSASSATHNNGGTIFMVSKASLQNQRLITTDMGYPRLGDRDQYNDNKPSLSSHGFNVGVGKAFSAGTFAVMAKGKYVIMGYSSVLAGVTTTALTFPGANTTNPYSQNIANQYRNTVLKRTTGGWYYQNGAPVNAQYSRDHISNEVNPNYASPGRLSFMVGSLSPTVTSYKAKTD